MSLDMQPVSPQPAANRDDKAQPLRDSIVGQPIAESIYAVIDWYIRKWAWQPNLVVEKGHEPDSQIADRFPNDHRLTRSAPENCCLHLG